ncbi:MAG: PQQ-dependent sugar dehydrogenase [Chromatiaceae bacterium]|nr:PQQ-dependent sugar dehydrogenase [Gammaproteobacteria bacterium]MCP5422989.1 PQQ-dependent sugar dehydrogenase [Chromatiaceae bacterium]
MRRLVTLFVELGIVAGAVFIADWLQGVVDIIPKWLLRLPEVNYDSADFWIVFKYFLVIHALVLGVAQWLLGAWRPGDAKRTVNEVFLLAVAFAISSLVVFVTTTVNFDPQFIVGIFVVCLLIYVVLYFVTAVPATGLVAALGGFFRALLRRVFSVPGVIALLLALSPGILAKLFTTDRDVANLITQIRINLNTSDTGGWTVENAIGGRSFLQPILVQFPPGRSDEMYVLERHGRLYRMPWNKPGQPSLVLDFSDTVGEVDAENGALGFDFHPEFGNAGSGNGGFIYLYYTSVLQGQQINHLSRFDLSSGEPQAVRASERVLMEIDRDEDGFHNGGSVEFGPDGFLYVAFGEMTDPDAHQRIDMGLSGGVLRIDVDQRGGAISHPIIRQPVNGKTQDYYIPNDNPFAGVPGVLEEFYAVGLRNPFRIAFDPANGNLWAGEVGSTVWEEVNLLRKGGNYQFPYIEGNQATGKPRPEKLWGDEVAPIYTYQHTAYERAVIGGIVYRGKRYPKLQGKYLFGDNYSGNIYALPASGEVVTKVELLGKANQYAQRGITSFVETPDGQILLTTLGSASGSSGEIIRLIPKSESSSDTAASAPVVSAPVSDADVKGLFSTNCSRCHGPSGRGDGPDSSQLGVPVPNFASAEFQTQRTDEDLIAVIKNGGGARGLSPMMPPWGMALSDAEINALVKYIRAQAVGNGER